MKEKILTIMFSLFCLTAAGQNNQNSTLWGDVNRDGVVSLIDADELANYIMGKPSAIPSETEADVNNDGFVNAADIVKIINVVNSSNTDIKNLFIWKSDGSYVTYRLNETEGLNFNDNGILVKSNGIDDTYYYNLISKITYGSSEEAAPSTVGTPAQDVTYIYRNDGGFNAFYNTEIETIRFSSLGIDGIVYPKLVVQEISTKDSLYRIPFSVIDSISFSKPATIYVNGVRKIDDLIPYITQAEDLSLTLSDNTPISLSPKIGEVLLYEHFDKDFLPYGFAGRVIQIVNSTYICEPVTLDDVYERLIGIGSAMFADAQQSGSPKTRGVSGESSDAIKLKITVGKEENGIHGSIEGFLACGIRVVYRHERNKSHYISATIAPKLGAAAEIGVNGKLEGDWIAPKIDLLYFPIPSTPFLLNLSSGPALKPSLEANLTARFELSWEGEMGFTFDNGSWHKYYRNLSKDKKPLEITGDVDGRLFTGVATDFGICSYGKILSLVKETEVGLDIVANLSTNLLNSNKYEELSNANVEANFIGNLGLKGELKFTRFIKFERKINIASLEWNINSWKVVPTFKNITVAPANNNSYVVSVEPSDKILWWLPIGLGLYDKNDELQDYNYCVDLYKDIDSWPLEKFQATFNNVSPSQEYTVAPLVKIFGVDLKASPEINISPSIKCTTGNASNINYSSATLNGTVENYNKEDENIKFVFLYSTSEDIQNSSDGRTVEATCDEDGNLTANITNLIDNTTYYYAAAYKAGNEDYVLGEVKSFKTNPSPYNSIVLSVSDVTPGSAILRAKVPDRDFWFRLAKKGEDFAIPYEYHNGNPTGEYNEETGEMTMELMGLDIDETYQFYVFYDSFKSDVFEFKTKDIDHDPYVDLGLSTKWATSNIGASDASATGSLFAWGETSPKNTFSKNNYEHYIVFEDDYSSYMWYRDIGVNISGSQYDAARIIKGSSWRMPTYTEWRELYTLKCFTSNYHGVSGVLFLAENGHSLFISYDLCWTATLSQVKVYNNEYAYVFDSECVDRRYSGHPIRPVHD